MTDNKMSEDLDDFEQLQQVLFREAALVGNLKIILASDAEPWLMVRRIERVVTAYDKLFGISRVEA